MKYALALEGGGARGAYQIGAVKALIEEGYEFSAVTGTSIGAINGAVIAQGDFDKVYDIWKEISYSSVFDVEDEKISFPFDLKVVRYLSSKFAEAVKGGGLDTSKIKQMLEKNIIEEKIRKSGIDFGLVTYCLSDKKPQELFLEDIPEGSLIDYIMASSRLPGFQKIVIDNKVYIDGGVFDNCPVNMLIEKGYKEIFAIRLLQNNNRNKIKNYNKILKKKDVLIHVISPVDNLPNILSFDNATSNKLLKLGYFDAMKNLKNLDGIRYYANKESEDFFFDKLCNLSISEIKKITKLLKIQFEEGASLRKILFEEIIGILLYKTKSKYITSYKDTIYSLIEYVAKKEKVKRYKIYDFEELLKEIKLKIKYEGLNPIDEAIYRIVNNI